MLRYLLKRLLWFIPTLLVISSLLFVISSHAPRKALEGDCLPLTEGGTLASWEQCQARLNRTFGLDKPTYYVELRALSAPDTLYCLLDLSRREAAERLLNQYGNWPQVQAWQSSILALQRTLSQRRIDSAGKQSTRQFQAALQASLNLMRQYRNEDIQRELQRLADQQAASPGLAFLQSYLHRLEQALAGLKETATPWKNYVPALSWHGLDNRYHHWLSQIVLHFDFGVSYESRAPVTQEIGDLFFYSFMFALLAVLITYLIGIPLGIWAAVRKDSAWDRGSAVLVFALDSIPNFWFATLLLIAFANPDGLNWFPSAFNLTYDTSLDRITRWILPLIAYTYGSLAFLSRTMRAGLLEVLEQDFIRTARAKGLSERKVVLQHALKNALLPIITLFVSVFPALIGGSAILEHIFTIPGLGWKIFIATEGNNTPMILAIFTLAGLLTMLGYLVADLLYAWVDPRIRFGKEADSL